LSYNVTAVSKKFQTQIDAKTREWYQYSSARERAYKHRYPHVHNFVLTNVHNSHLSRKCLDWLLMPAVPVSNMVPLNHTGAAPDCTHVSVCVRFWSVVVWWCVRVCEVYVRGVYVCGVRVCE
jgi:hypothetical protein